MYTNFSRILSNYKVLEKLIGLFLLVKVVQCNDVNSSSSLPILIIVSFDGFRFNFFNKGEFSALEAFRSEGTSVPYMRNQFVTKTFPNHMSIATGLFTENHGVVDNEIFDPLYNLTLKADSNLFWNYDNDTLPLWTVNELAGEGRRSGVMMWPGSDHPYGLKNDLKLPFRVEAWNESIPFKWRIDRVIDWMTDEKEPVNLVFMYFEEPDEYAHAFGPESQEVTEKIKKLDNATSYLVQQLKEKNIYDEVNLVLLSDHGFEQVRAQDLINISKIVDPTLYKSFGGTPVMQLIPKEGKFDEIYKALKDASTSMNFSVYSKQEIANVPGWHYSKNRRIHDIVLVADLGFVFEDFVAKIDWYNTHFNRTPSPDNRYGVHGYDNRLFPMHPFFMARGPIFKRKFVGSPFDNVDLFPLFCRILGIDAPGNNGSYANVKNLIITQGFAVGSPPIGWAIGAGLVVGVMILLGIMSILASSGRERGRSFLRGRDSEANARYNYRFINRRNSDSQSDENDNLEVTVVSPSSSPPPTHEKQEYQPLLTEQQLL